MNQSVLFVTGTDTSVGKTWVAALLTRYLGREGVSVAALKPVSSGSRDDAKALRSALNGALSLDEINPWHFRAPLAPLLAARRDRKKLTVTQVLVYVRRMQRRYANVIIEGAGGLLSPLGEGFDSRDLIVRLQATPIVVCPNRLGAINQARLTLAALPRTLANRAQVILVTPRQPDRASHSNPVILKELLGKRIHVLPWSKSTRAHKSSAGVAAAILAAVEPRLPSRRIVSHQVR